MAYLLPFPGASRAVRFRIVRIIVAPFACVASVCGAHVGPFGELLGGAFVGCEYAFSEGSDP